MLTDKTLNGPFNTNEMKLRELWEASAYIPDRWLSSPLRLSENIVSILAA